MHHKHTYIVKIFLPQFYNTYHLTKTKAHSKHISDRTVSLWEWTSFSYPVIQFFLPSLGWKKDESTEPISRLEPIVDALTHVYTRYVAKALKLPGLLKLLGSKAVYLIYGQYHQGFNFWALVLLKRVLYRFAQMSIIFEFWAENGLKRYCSSNWWRIWGQIKFCPYRAAGRFHHNSRRDCPRDLRFSGCVRLPNAAVKFVNQQSRTWCSI